MDKEEIEFAMQKIVKESQTFEEAPSYSLALELDKDLSILRYIIGEQNFLGLHYFRRIHEEAIKFIDAEQKKRIEKVNSHNN